MQFDYDPKRGLLLPPMERRKAAPNPTSEPPIEPIYKDELERVARRLDRKLRFWWEPEMGVHYIQQQNPDGQWRSVFVNLDQEASHEGNQFPYRPVDMRCIREFCASSLQLTRGSGDFDRDRASMDREANERGEKEKAERDHRTTGLIAAMISGGDERRFGKLLRHDQVHAQTDQDPRQKNSYVRFQEFFQVAKNAPVGKPDAAE